jgi:hypothetical protein
MRPSLRFGASSALLAACALGSCTSAEVPSSSGQGGAAAIGDDGKVHGTAIDTRLTDTGRVPEPVAGTLEAVVTVDGATKKVTAAIAADGSFALDVPAGASYAWHFAGGTSWQISTARTLDLGTLVAGRPAATSPTLATAFTVDVGGLSPWQDGGPSDPKNPSSAPTPEDDLQLASLGGATWIPLALDLQAGGTGVARGAQGIKGTLDLHAEGFAGLMSGSAGDRAYVVQLVGHEQGARAWAAAERGVKLAAPDVKDGEPAKLAATLAPLDTTSHAFDWRRSDFAALLADVPGARPLEADLSVYMEADPVISSAGAFYAELCTMSSAGRVGDDPAEDVKLAAKLGNPFPAEMQPTTSASLVFRVDGEVPGETDPRGLSGTLGVTVPLDEGGALVPVVSPPRNATVAGFAPTIVPGSGAGGAGGGSGAGGASTHVTSPPTWKAIESVGTTPTIAWDPPAKGTPTYYVLTIRKLDPKLATKVAGRVTTTGTTVKLPDGLLEKGGTYYVRIGATVDALWTQEKPLAHGVKSAVAETVTPIFTP